MAKFTDSKCKQCRRAGEKLFLKGERCQTPKCAVVKKNYPPGFHGPKRRKRITDYGLQLAEKQKAKRQYNLLEKQFKLIFNKARRQKGDAGENFLKLLEMRLDNVIYRAGFGSSRPQSRQLVNHGHFTVNGHRVNIPSYLVKSGDIIGIKNRKRQAKIFKNLAEKLKNKEIPGWIDLDKKELIIKILHEPDIGTLKTNFNVQVIIEYYSR